MADALRVGEKGTERAFRPRGLDPYNAPERRAFARIHPGGIRFVLAPRSLFFVLVFAAASASGTASAFVPPCGQVIDGPFVLDGDLGPCPTGEALIVVGPGGSVDLNGFTVSCATAASDGILLDGEGAELSGGQVTGCDDGVVLAGAGGHTVRDVSSFLNFGDGFQVDSHDNVLIDDVAEDNAGDGFHVDGDENLLKRNDAIDNGDDGFDVFGILNKLTQSFAADNTDDGYDFTGHGNEIHKSEASANDDNGYEIVGSFNLLGQDSAFSNGDDGFEIAGMSNQVRKCLSQENGDDGFDLDFFAFAAKLSQNEALGNVDDGFVGNGLENEYRRNRAFDNGDDGMEFDVDAFLSRVVKNVTEGNGENGIEVSGTSLTVLRNRSFDNDVTTVGGFDLFDANADCDDNSWRQNRFGTANQACVQ